MLEYKYFIQKIYQASSDIIVIEVADKNGGAVFDFKPGQYAMISYENEKGRVEDKHAFSIASSPTQKNLIRFGIKVQGLFTQGLLKLKVGDEILISGPFGVFTYDERKYQNAVFIAGGIGITPFLSSLRYATDFKLNNKLAVIYSARTIKGAAFYEEINSLKKENSNISTLFSFTEETDTPKESNVLYKRVTANDIKDFIGDLDNKTFFVCGPTLFMAGMIANLLSLGVKKGQIKMEEFSMIPDQSLWSRLKNISYATGFALILSILSFILITKMPALSDSEQNYNLNPLEDLNKSVSEYIINIDKDENQENVTPTKPNNNKATEQITNKNSSPTVNTISTKATYTPPVSVPTPTTRVS